jgi:ABC-type Na+ efflux pump permease subunit
MDAQANRSVIMAWPLGPGPVFAYERVAGARRWQTYALRALFVAMLLLGMTVTWWGMASNLGLQTARYVDTLRHHAEVGQKYGYALVGIQLSLVLLAAPAATAGAICMDKARGNLALMLVTDLSNAEIVLGKLAARLLPVLGLVACALPVISLGTLLGGLDPAAMGLAFLVTMDVAVLGCALALALSVWAVKVHEALMATYLFWCVVTLAYPTWQSLGMTGTPIGFPPTWLRTINPFWLAFAPSVAPASIAWTDYIGFTTGCLGLSALLVSLSTVLLRKTVLGQAARAVRSLSRWALPNLRAPLRRVLPGPSLDGNPVLWREWHRDRPSAWGRVIWGSCAIGTTVLGAWSTIDALDNGVGARPMSAVLAIMLIVFVGLLLVSASTATSLTEERVRGSLDALLATPLSTWSIVWGKWWGAFRPVPWLTLWPAILAAAVAFTTYNPPARPPGWVPVAWDGIGPGLRTIAVGFIVVSVLAHGALLASLGLALATWIKKPGRAMGLVVTAYVFVTVGWPILMVVLFERAGMNGIVEGLAELSPVFASISVIERLCRRDLESLLVSLGWGLFWLLHVATAAAGLLAATWKSFDRCMGRIPEDLDYAELAALARVASYGSRGSQLTPRVELKAGA